ncbi:MULTISPECIES: SDR family NAD(P)-dependent oxidoreductase [unclassified Halomonas]|uniref:SDR family NAD(P)-dependent oxidoreductase n=1 Tax=unclassified Halomonas TaxID=2609666 RepID=UPI001CF197A7|nr:MULTISPECIES: SDR family oxidoreductase [unclassified Halomonas]MCA8864334.1 SDR family oxidoreductase [Halomonas sp. SBBP1]UZH10051.1 SDR family oxidoreductase [Halomonas sp. BDJS001]
MNTIDKELNNMVAIITGAGGGIGEALAYELGQCGARMVLGDLTSPEELAVKLRAFGIECRACVLDVTDAASIASVVEAEERVDILVNNAGIMQPKIADHHEQDVALLPRMLDVHVGGASLMASAVLPGMSQRGSGRIINIGSVIGHVGLQRRTAYSVAKSAIGGLTRGLALEYGRRGITVNTVSPGYTLTEPLRRKMAAGTLDYALFAERSAVGRWADPTEIARVVRFLAEPSSGFITGADWLVDGGYAINGNPGESLGPLSIQ